MTPLLVATCFCQMDAIRLLLEYGANLEAKGSVRSARSSHLQAAE